MVEFSCRERTGTCLQIFKTVDTKKNKIVDMNVTSLFSLSIYFITVNYVIWNYSQWIVKTENLTQQVGVLWP